MLMNHTIEHASDSRLPRRTLVGCAVATAFAAIVSLAGCSSAPVYQRPALETGTAFKEASFDGRAWKTAEPRDHLPRGPWWEIFGDPVLNTLAAQVIVNNQNIKLSAAKYAQALALIQSARAAYFPVVTLSGGETRARNATAGISSPAPTTTDSVSASLSNWEIDLWGRIRGGVDANEASAVAALADVESAKLSMTTQMVQAYFSLRLLDEQTKLLTQTAEEYKKALTLTENRYRSGVAAKSDVTQALTQLKSTQAQAIDAGIARAQYAHSIAVLTGKLPSELDLPVMALQAKLPEIPLTAPSDLLERRPDIAAAERRVAAANAQIGVATAALFPALTLSSTVGFRNNKWADLLTVPFRFWSIGPALAFTLFDGGAKRAQISQAEAVHEQTAATYRQTVLTAFQAVEDNLASIRILKEEAVVQQEAVRAAEESLFHVLNQYKAGVATYLNVVTAQTAALSNARALLSVQNSQYQASINLVTALGGGFDVKEPLRGEPRQ
jgi:NodT family efflux transporter outer membrane factor (OMF) lipoprotein